MNDMKLTTMQKQQLYRNTNSNYAETQTVIMQKLQSTKCTIYKNNNYAEKHKNLCNNKQLCKN